MGWGGEKRYHEGHDMNDFGIVWSFYLIIGTRLMSAQRYNLEHTSPFWFSGYCVHWSYVVLMWRGQIDG